MLYVCQTSQTGDQLYSDTSPPSRHLTEWNLRCIPKGKSRQSKYLDKAMVLYLKIFLSKFYAMIFFKAFGLDAKKFQPIKMLEEVA